MNLIDRFHAKYTALSDKACWLWTSATVQGYGVITVRPGQQEYAHRLAWRLHHDRDIPPGKLVCHSCGNRLCVNPAHLFLGDHKDRVYTGSRKGRAKVTPEQVVEIREKFATGEWTCNDLAEKYRLSAATIRLIVKGKIWQDVGGPIHVGRIVGRKTGNRRLTLEQVEEARRRVAAGETQVSVAEEMGVHYSHMSRIVRGERW